jgi:hypothetical protein
MDQGDPVAQDEVQVMGPVDQVARDRVGQDSDHPMLRWIFRSCTIDDFEEGSLSLGAQTSCLH